MRRLTALLGLTATLASAQESSARRLDYDGAIQQGSLLYIPYQGLAPRGPVYFSQYQEEATKTSGAGDLRRLFVNLVPVAFRDGSYTAFVEQHGILDDKVFPVPSSACRPSPAVQELLAGMPPGYQPTILGGNWPFLCTLSLYFLPEDEAAVRGLLASGSGITLRATVSLCSPESPQVDSPAVVSRLLDRGELVRGSASQVSGALWDVLYGSAAVVLERPGLFATSDAREGWTAWFRELTLDPTGQTATMEGLPVQNPIYVCRPTSLTLEH